MSDAVLTPEGEGELSQLLREADAPLRIVGGGTRPIGSMPQTQVLSTKKLSGVSLYEPEALTLVAGAGTPVAEIEALLDKEGQMLAFEPMDHRALLGTQETPTIGAVVACNISGPRRVRAGACRDYLLGLRFVDGAGNIVKNGGRVMKNVTGYDLARLQAGARGTLGVLTEMGFKVLPKPEVTAVLLLTGLGVKDAIEAMSDALSSPYEVSGAAHIPVGLDGDPVTMIRIEGFETQIAHRSTQLKDLLTRFAPVDVERRISENGGYGTDAGWRWVRDVEIFADTPGDVWRVVGQPNEVAALVDRAGARASLIDWGGGLIWFLTEPGHDLRTTLGSFTGHATLIRASEEDKAKLGVFPPLDPAILALNQGLRQKFDPRNILNTGLMG